MNIVITDFEGTLSDNRGRIPLAVQGKWDEFFRSIEHDPLRVDILEKIKSYGLPVHILTGVPEQYRPILETWLKKYGITYERMIMKAKGDFRTSDITKWESYERDFKDYNVKAIFEDLPRVVAMWKEKGAPVVDVKLPDGEPDEPVGGITVS